MKKLMTVLSVLISLISKAQTSDKLPSENIRDSVFQKVEIKAAFPLGPKSWYRYVEKEFEKNNINLKKYKNAGACELQFIVNKEGLVSEVSATALADTKLAEVMVSIIKNGPRWVPAILNGRMVSSLRKITIKYPLESSIY